MPAEKTTILGLVKNDSSSMGATLNLDGLVVLDEGFSRPHWAFANISHEAFRLIPESPDTILLDGLLLIASEFLDHQEIQKSLRSAGAGSSRVIDLNSRSLDDAVRAKLAAALKGFTVLVICLAGSSVARQIAEAEKLGISFRVVMEDRS